MIVTNAETVAVVPARGGSKGIPRKNVIDVSGRPLIAWTIDAVRTARLPMRLIVTTDSPEIAEVSQQLGAEVVRRPDDLALDTSPTEPGVLHALAETEIDDSHTVILLQATSPIRRPGMIDEAHAAYIKSGADSLAAVVEESPFLWTGPPDDGHPLYDIEHRPRRQDFSENDMVYRESGSLYISGVAGFRRHRNRLHGRVALFVTEPREGLDVDTEYDLAMARSLLSNAPWTGIAHDPHS